MSNKRHQHLFNPGKMLHPGKLLYRSLKNSIFYLCSLDNPSLWIRQFAVILGIFSATTCTNAYSSTVCENDSPPKILNKDIALQRLLVCNRDIVDIKRSVIANEANLKIAGQTQNPNLTVGVGNINPKLGIGAGSYFDKTIDNSVRYEQLIERGNKRELRVKTAQGQIAASKQDVFDVERQQSIVLLKAMVDLATIDERAKLLAEVVSLYEETLHANNIRAEKGDLPRLDAERQKIDSLHAQIDLQQALADEKGARLALASLLAWEAQADDLNVNVDVLDITHTDALNFNPNERADVRAAKSRVEAAQSQLDLAQAQLKADVTAGVQVDHWPTSRNNPTGTGDTIGFTVSIPLTVNHHYDGEIARATSDYDAAREMLEHAEANAKADWLRMNADVASAESNLRILQIEQMPRAEEVARTVELGYKKGALTLLDLLDARRMLRQTHLDTLSARAALARATLARDQSLATIKD